MHFVIRENHTVKFDKISRRYEFFVDEKLIARADSCNGYFDIEARHTVSGQFFCLKELKYDSDNMNDKEYFDSIMLKVCSRIEAWYVRPTFELREIGF